jgi:hypothetical protein
MQTLFAESIDVFCLQTGTTPIDLSSAAMHEPAQHIADHTCDQQSRQRLLRHILAYRRGKVTRLVSSVAIGNPNLAGDVTGLAFDLRPGVARQTAYGVLNLPSNILKGTFDSFIHFGYSS